MAVRVISRRCRRPLVVMLLVGLVSSVMTLVPEARRPVAAAGGGAVVASTAAQWSTFAPLSPVRLWDSRVGPGPVGRIGAGEARAVTVTGIGGVPAEGVTAVVLNVTAVALSAGTFVTVWPTGETRPLASNLNLPGGDTRPNLVTVKVGTSGHVSFYNDHGTVDLIVDVAGWYGPTAGQRYTATSPSRLWDSRVGPGAVGRIGAEGTRDVTVSGIGGVPASDVTAVVLNVTAVAPTADTFVTAWPTGEPRALASNLNIPAGDTRPNLVIVKVGAGGRVSFYNEAGSTDLIADVAGWFGPSGTGMTSVSPSRVWDSRSGPGALGRIGAGPARDVIVTGVGGVPAGGVAAVVLNVTAVGPSAGTYVTAWPTGEARPLASNLNVPAGDTRANLVIVKVGDGGRVSFSNAAGTIDLIADVAGWFEHPPPPIADAPAGSATAYQVNPTHDGRAPGTLTLSQPAAPKWSHDFGAVIGYPLKVGGRVFVSVGSSSQGGADVYALDAGTGGTLWGPVALGGSYPFAALTADSEAVYGINFNGLLTALDQATGQVRWSRQLPGSSFTSPPTASGGSVYVAGGFSVFGVDSRTGTVRWRTPVVAADHTSPAVVDDEVYVSTVCGLTYRLDAVTGAKVWTSDEQCFGSGGRTPVVHGDSVYVREPNAGLLQRSRATGAVLRTFDAFVAPAFDGDLGFFLAGSVPWIQTGWTLSAINQVTGSVLWSTTGDGRLVMAPVVIDGKVIVGSATGEVIALDQQTGAQLWWASAGASMSPPDEHNAFQTVGFNVADGVLLVPNGGRLLAFG